MLEVTIGKMPGTGVKVAHPESLTVQQAADMAGLSNLSGYDVTVNGEVAKLSTLLRNDDSVWFTKRVKGNQQVVTIGKMPGVGKQYGFPDGERKTVADIAAAVELSLNGFDITINGEVASPSTRVKGDDSIWLTKRVKGNK